MMDFCKLSKITKLEVLEFRLLATKRYNKTKVRLC